MKSNSIKFLISDEAKKVNDIRTRNSGSETYTPKQEVKFKAVILNRSVWLGEDYEYFYFIPEYNEFTIFIVHDEYSTPFKLLDNTVVFVDVSKDTDNKYILFIDIRPTNTTKYIEPVLGDIKFVLTNFFLDHCKLEYDGKTKISRYYTSDLNITSVYANGNSIVLHQYQYIEIPEKGSIVSVYDKDCRYDINIDPVAYKEVEISIRKESDDYYTLYIEGRK